MIDLMTRAAATDSPDEAVGDLRLHDRVKGPFDGRRVGLLETTVQIYDLSAGGCFITSQHEQREGAEVVLRLDLGQAGWMTTKARIVRCRPGCGFGVRFTEMSDADRERLEHAVAERLVKGLA